MASMSMTADELRHINAFLQAQTGIHPAGSESLSVIFQSQKAAVLGRIQKLSGLHAGGGRELIEIISGAEAL